MITTSQEHIDLLASRNFVGTDLYAIEMFDGTVLRYAVGGVSTVWGGHTFSGAAPIIERDEIRRVAGLEANSLSLTLWPREEDVLLGLPWRDACSNGALDGARITAWRAHSARPGDPVVGAVRLFTGDVGDVEVTVADGIVLPVTSKWAVLDRKVPVGVFQPDCGLLIYSAGCGLSRNAYQVSGSLLAGSEADALVTGLSAADGEFTGGELRMVSGASAGARRAVKRHASGTLHLAYPLQRGVAAGDAFLLWPGCDGTHARCQRFNNTARFKGQPLIPAAETAY